MTRADDETPDLARTQLASTVGSREASDRTTVIPATIGRFEIQSKLGEGGMGVVLLATDPALGRRVAIKVLRGNLQGDGADAGRRRLLREAQATAQLSHENVIVVHEVGTHDDQVYLAMEYVIGGTLTRWQVDRDWRQVLATYLRAGRGLQAAHDAGLVHRDFKPDNVLVGDDGRVRVTDFGLVAAAGDAGDQLSKSEVAPQLPSQLAAKLTETGAVMGTPRYMAPEQHLGRVVDARADQFAFCVALYEALYRQPPFAGATYAQLVESVLAGDVLAVPDGSLVPGAIAVAVRRGLRRDPDDRFPTMRELLAALELPEPAVPARRSRWPLVAVMGALGGAVAIYAVVAVATRTDSLPDAHRSSLAEAHEDALRTAQSKFGDGQSAYVDGNYDEAARAFQAAYSARQFPEFLYDAAASFHMKGRFSGDAAAFDRAVELYAKYLALDPRANEKPKIEEAIRVLRDGVARRREREVIGDIEPRGLVVIETEPQGATVYLDDQKEPFATTPWFGSLEGTHTIRIAKPDYQEQIIPIVGEPHKLVVLGGLLGH